MANYNGLLSTYVGHEMNRRAEGIEWGPKGQCVELILNGLHLGVYDLRENIRIGKDRINITPMTSFDISEDAITGGYLFTYDNTWDEINKFRSKYYNYPVMFKDPDEDILTTEQFNYLQDYINDFEYSLKNNELFAQRKYLDYIDINSFVDCWFVEEMARDSDYPIPRSVWFHKDRDGKIKQGPAWDFDGMTFSSKSLLCKTALYNNRLFQDSYFVMKVQERWPYFKSALITHEKYDTTIAEYVNLIYSQVKRSVGRDKVIWPGSNCNLDGQYNAMINGIESKLNWLEDIINSLQVSTIMPD